jgi:TolB-like protein/DNA-binding winged helix-turn-helix (wHTH) protein/Tfp pilus assembly protein PilF
VSANPSSRIIRFSTFEVNLETGELRRRGQKVKLQEQPLQVLAALLERPGELVTREELHRKLWATDTFVDFDHSLNAAIKRLRDALGESAERPVFIETLARRGYRFICPSNMDPMQQAPPHSLLPVASVKSVSRRHLLSLGGIVFATCAVVVGLNWGHFSGSRTDAREKPIMSLAVLPLENLSRDPEQEYFSDGMTEALTDDLSKTSNLRVISSLSTMRYKATNKPLAEIARELNVDGVIQGSVLRVGNSVRIRAELIDARTDQHLWGQSYEHDLEDILILQNDLAQAIAERTARLTTQRSSVRSTSVVNPEAYEAYLMAISLDWSRQQGIRKSESYLEKAIQKDPDFAPAYVELAWRYLDLGQFRWLSPEEAYAPAKQYLHKALELDQQNCRAHFQLAWLAWRYDWDWQTAESEFKHAVELCPSDARIHWEHAYYLAWSGHGAEAQAEIAKTREVDPLMPYLFGGAALINYQLRNYPAMIDTGRRYVASDANLWAAHYFLAIGYEGSGQTAEAISEYQKAVELSQGDQDPTAALAHAYATTGKKAETEKILNEWLRRSETGYVSPYMVATTYAALGDKGKAFAYLEKAYRERSSDLPYFLKADLRVDSLRSDPRFQDLMRRMNFPK